LAVSRIPSPVERVVYTVDEACSVLRISRATVYTLMKNQQLRYFQIGSRRRIPASEISRLVGEADCAWKPLGVAAAQVIRKIAPGANT
jgi:excisionase family DNA binding protein